MSSADVLGSVIEELRATPRLANDGRVPVEPVVFETLLDIAAAGAVVLAGLNERIDAAPMSAKPVFSGIYALYAALSRLES